MLRAALAGLSGLLAVVLLPVALVAVWLHTVVTDTDRYVETVRPLAAERQVKGAVEDLVTAALLDQVGRLELGALGVPLTEDQVAEVVRQAVRGVVVGDVFPRVWTAAQRAGHRQALGLLRGRGVPPTVDGVVALRLDPVVDGVLDRLSELGLPLVAELPPLEVAVPLVPVRDLRAARTAYRLLDAGWLVVPLVTGGAALLALLLARRRARALGWLALFGAGALFGTAGLVVVGRSAAAAAPRSRAEEVIAGRVADALTAGLLREALLGAALCGVLAVLAAVAAAGSRRRVS